MYRYFGLGLGLIFQIGEFFDENWAKDINVTCLNKLS